jgi:Family of unknown function (DUF5996)
MAQPGSVDTTPWPPLPFEEWKATYATLHMWTQVVGKIRLVQAPWTNHSWHTTFYVTSRGLTTSPIPHQARTFQIEFDFIDHRLLIATSSGAASTMALRSRPVAEFYKELFERLAELGFGVAIRTTPCEVVDAIPFEKDAAHATYAPEHASRFFHVLAQADRVLKEFRARFIGKCSPVHFFWGGFDLAVTRFSGRKAPMHPGGIPHLADWVTREAYSHEVSSCGFWPGNDQLPQPVFYAYAYPEPRGFRTATVRPDAAAYNAEFGEFILPYNEVRQSSAPDATLLEFLQTTYEAAADLGAWDRAALERAEIPHPAT